MFGKKSQQELDDALLAAIAAHKFDKARKLLDKGAQIDACDAGGNGVLHALTGAEKYLERWDVSSFVTELMRRGADVNAANNKGQTCLHVMAQTAHNREPFHADMLDAVLDFGMKSSRRCEDLELLTMLRVHGARLDIQDAAGRLPAHICAARNDLEMTQACLPDAQLYAVQDKNGQRPVDLVKPGSLLARRLQENLQKLEKKQTKQSKPAKQDKPQKAAVPPPAAAPAAGSDSWVLLKPDQVAHVSVEPVIGYKLTEVFNFTSRIYTRITHNLETRVDVSETRGFDDFSDKSVFAAAREELLRLGGRVDKSSVTGVKPLDKPKL